MALIKWTGAALALTLAAGAAQAQLSFKNDDDAVEYRKGTFNVMSKHFARLGAMANGKMPFNAAVAQADADVVATLSQLPWQAFGESTKNAGNTKAKPEVWSEWAKFKAGGDKLEEEAKKLQAAAKTGNLDNVKAAFGAAAQTCKACHDSYKNK